MIRRPKPTTVNEASVTRAVIEHMRSLGYREKRNHVGLFYTEHGTPIHMGKVGEPDWLFLKPNDVVYIEIKAPGKKPKPEQLEYIAKLQHLGFKATWCDSVEMLCKYLETTK